MSYKDYTAELDLEVLQSNIEHGEVHAIKIMTPEYIRSGYIYWVNLQKNDRREYELLVLKEELGDCNEKALEFVEIFTPDEFIEWLEGIINEEPSVIIRVSYYTKDTAYLSQKEECRWEIRVPPDVFKIEFVEADEDLKEEGIEYLALLITPEFSLEEFYDELGERVTYIYPRYTFTDTYCNHYFWNLFKEVRNYIPGWGYIREFLEENILPLLKEDNKEFKECLKKLPKKDKNLVYVYLKKYR